MVEQADTVGLSLIKKQFIWHRLDLTADATYSRAATDVDVRGGSYANNPFALAGAPVLAAGVPAVLYVPAANLPPVTTKTIDLRLGARVSVGKSGEVRVFYEVQRMKATDYAYDGMQFGTGTEQLPSLEQAPDYTVHVVGLTFGYRF